MPDELRPPPDAEPAPMEPQDEAIKDQIWAVAKKHSSWSACTQEEAWDDVWRIVEDMRLEGLSVVVPLPADDAAVERAVKAFPNYKVVGLNSAIDKSSEWFVIDDSAVLAAGEFTAGPFVKYRDATHEAARLTVLDVLIALREG